MIVKICGITNREDALAAVDAGASALGFNFYPESPRYVSPETAASIAADLPILKVGVFVNDADAIGVAARAGVDVIQLHGDEPADQVPAAIRTWKAFRVTSEWNAALLATYPVEAFLLDGPLPGCGQTFDWTCAMGPAMKTARIILAGGLGPENVGEAIRLTRPWGVDACSRLERAPGLKDHDRMRRFVRAAMENI